MNGVRSDNSENFVEARAIEVVDIDEAFEDVVWELQTTDAIWLVDLVDIVKHLKNFFIGFVDTYGVIDFNLTLEELSSLACFVR